MSEIHSSDRHPENGHTRVPDDWELVEKDGAGPFETRAVYRLPDGSTYVWESRRHRKGRGAKDTSGQAAEAAQAFHESVKDNPWLGSWAPRRISWWVAVLFVVGSVLFAVGALASLFPEVLGGVLVADWSYFVGALLYTIGVYLQILEAINFRDYIGAASSDGQEKGFEWFAWQPRRLSFMAPFVLLIGALLFNVETTLALAEGLGLIEVAALLVTWASITGSALFVVATYLQLIETCHGYWCRRPREISWWLVVLYVLGSIGFLVGSAYGIEVLGLASPAEALIVKLSLLVGSVLFLIGSYLMLPEMFSE